MAEDQGVNGDIWNDKINHLLSLLGWQSIGDHNMDLIGSDSKGHGVDALMCYEDKALNLKQSCIVESKYYKVSSLDFPTISGWFEVLKNKLDLFYQSFELSDKFPELVNCTHLNLGVIMCWVYDAETYSYFENIFNTKYWNRLKFNSPSKQFKHKRIVLLENTRILKLHKICELKLKHNFEFVYTSSMLNGRPDTNSDVLTIDYALSNIIFAESKDIESKIYYVLYFGKDSINSYKLILQALKTHGLWKASYKYVIYHSNEEFDFRKIEPDIRSIFSEVNLEIKTISRSNINSFADFD